MFLSTRPARVPIHVAGSIQVFDVRIGKSFDSFIGKWQKTPGLKKSYRPCTSGDQKRKTGLALDISHHRH
jgi:hypothetical protein